MTAQHLLIAFLLGTPTLAAAQATVTVAPSDPVYRSVDRLMTNGLVDDMIVGQRPYTRREIARLILGAMAPLKRLQSELSDRDLPSDVRTRLGARVASLLALLTALRLDFASELRSLADSGRGTWTVHPIHDMELDVTSGSGSARRVPESNGLGEIDGWIAPLYGGREGRLLTDGKFVSAEGSHVLESPHFAFQVVPRVSAAWDTPRRAAVTKGHLQNLEIRILFGNVALDVGREYLVWGQGRDVGLLGSTNSPGFDLVKLSNESLVRLPWILRRLGASKFSAFYSDLGRQQNFPSAYLAGYKLSVTPSKRVELGAAVYSKSGGHGAPRASFSSRILDLFPFINAAFYNNVLGTRNQQEFSDRYAGVDARLRFPRAHGLELFGELLLNDFDVRRLRSVLWEDAGHVLGVTQPRLGNAENLSIRVELHHTGIRYYEHSQFTSGQTLRQTLIGDPLGPNAHGVYLLLDWDASSRRWLSIDLAAERRSNDQYTGVALPGGSLAFRRTEERPKEIRYRALGRWSLMPSVSEAGVSLQAGFERSRNFDFVAGQHQTGVLARVTLDYRFH